MLLLWSSFFRCNRFVAFARQPSAVIRCCKTDSIRFWIYMNAWMNASEWKMLKSFIRSASLFHILLQKRAMRNTESTRAARISSAIKLDALNGKVRQTSSSKEQAKATWRNSSWRSDTAKHSQTHSVSVYVREIEWCWKKVWNEVICLWIIYKKIAAADVELILFAAPGSPGFFSVCFEIDE